MFAESSASDLFRTFMGNETNCSTNQMARKPMNVNKNKLLKNEPVHAKRYKFSNFSFLHKTEEKFLRIYFLVFVLPKSEENLINDVIKFYYVIWSYSET